MRILCISDTHGHLSQINDLIEKTHADAVIHAGDFGFYDDDSVERLEARELFLRVVHSELSPAEKTRAKKFSGRAMRDFIKAHLPLSDLGAWLKEGRGFRVPVYAVWGNHEDRVVIEDLLAQKTKIPNLHLLHEGISYRVGPLRLFGLGGNIIAPRLADLPSQSGQSGVSHRPTGEAREDARRQTGEEQNDDRQPASFASERAGETGWGQGTLTGNGGKIWSTLSQIGRLAQTLDDCQADETRVFVTHVSAGREPIAEWLAAALRADVTVSGHMGSPWNVVWSEFSVHTPAEANTRIDDTQRALQEALAAPLPQDATLRAWVERAHHIFPEKPANVVEARGERMPHWYKGAFHLNLPDVPDGYAVLTCGERLALETFSRGLWLKKG
jgi:predicted phosphodiesterase